MIVIRIIRQFTKNNVLFLGFTFNPIIIDIIPNTTVIKPKIPFNNIPINTAEILLFKECMNEYPKKNTAWLKNKAVIIDNTISNILNFLLCNMYAITTIKINIVKIRSCKIISEEITL